MLLAIEKVLILKSVPIFASVPEAELVDLATIVESEDFSEGELIIREGDLGTSMYIVASGKVRIQHRRGALRPGHGIQVNIVEGGSRFTARTRRKPSCRGHRAAIFQSWDNNADCAPYGANCSTATTTK